MRAIYSAFPLLRGATHQKTSESTTKYNCIAWAVGDTTRAWWPDTAYARQYYWPLGIPREATIEAFAKMFQGFGFSPCNSGEYEAGYVKIALYAKNRIPTHAAKQSDNGLWSSKLGDEEDLDHPLEALVGLHYGQVIMFFRKPT